jgi:hypothetical protein
MPPNCFSVVRDQPTHEPRRQCRRLVSSPASLVCKDSPQSGPTRCQPGAATRPAVDDVRSSWWTWCSYLVRRLDDPGSSSGRHPRSRLQCHQARPCSISGGSNRARSTANVEIIDLWRFAVPRGSAGWSASVDTRARETGPVGQFVRTSSLYLATPPRHLSTPAGPECVFELFTRVSQVSRPLTSPALGLQPWIVDRAADCLLDLARDLVHLVSGLIRTAHWCVLLFRLRILR